MNRIKRDDYLSYTKLGEFKFLEIPCEKCKHKLANPEVCNKYPDGKPIGVLSAEEECPNFKQKKKSLWSCLFR